MLFYPYYKNMLKEIGRKNGENWIIKELCHEDIAVFGQFCAEVIT